MKGADECNSAWSISSNIYVAPQVRCSFWWPCVQKDGWEIVLAFSGFSSEAFICISQMTNEAATKPRPRDTLERVQREGRSL